MVPPQQPLYVVCRARMVFAVCADEAVPLTTNRRSSARDNEDVAKRLEQTELEMKLLLSALQQSGVQVMKGAIQGRPKHDASEMFTASR